MFTEENTLTSELRGQRTLAAIMFTDVVSFSALMAANEEYTLDLLRRDFRIMRQLCQRFEGKVLKTIGDALLMYFTSAVQAVACAQEIQTTLAQAAEHLAQEDILVHRIGIHLGDVFFNGTDVMGDGVNIAARLQAEAEPGGICISQTVYDVVKKTLSLKATDLVQKKLKNIQDSVAVYQIPPISPHLFTNEWQLEPSPTKAEHHGKEPDLVVHSSKEWVLLGEHCFQMVASCRNEDGTLTVQIASKSLQDDVAIQSLYPNPEQPQLIKYAYRDDGYLVYVRSIAVTSGGDCPIWTLLLAPEIFKFEGSPLEQSYKGRKHSYSADEIAVLRARRILLNDPPKLLMDARLFTPESAEREALENLIQGNDGPIKIKDCVLHSLYPKYKHRRQAFLELARLEAVFMLKVTGIVEQVVELSLGLIAQDKVHVRFRGRRRHIYVDVEPAIIEVEGDCVLFVED